MKKSILISIITVSILAIVAGAAIGLVYTFSPNGDSELEVVSVLTDSETDQVILEIQCNEEPIPQQHQYQNQSGFRRMFAYMHQFQFNNSETCECMLEEQVQNQFQHRIQAGETMMFQFHIEGLEQEMQLMLQIEYNNGKLYHYQFQVNK